VQMVQEAPHPTSIIPELYPKRLPRAVLFDWDNTLIDSWRVTYEALNTALEGVGKRALTLEEFSKNPHLSIRDAAPTLFGDAAADEGELLFYEAVQRLHLEQMITLEGVEPLLKELRKRNIYVGVVSNKDGNILRKEIEHLGWGPHFHRVVGSRDAEADKPSHHPVVAALHESMIDPGHDVWFVGDSVVDVQCARASGCIPIVVGEGPAAREPNVVHVKDCLGLAYLIQHL